MAALLRTAALILGLLLAGCAGTAPPPVPPPVPPPGGERGITLVHPWSGDTARATYRRADGYDPHAFASIAWVLRDRRAGQVGPVDPALLDMLWDIRALLGLPEETPIHVISGYRAPETNAQLARTNGQVAENSYYLRGMAVDIRIPGVPGRDVAAALTLRRGGWAHYPKTDHVHLDTGPFRTWKGH